MEMSAIREYVLSKKSLVPILRPLYRLIRDICGKVIYLLNHFIRISSLNIGGGPNFCALGWINFDSVKSIINPNPFILTNNCTFPVEDRSLELVYTSHCLEHLDTNTVYRIFQETARVLKDGEQFVIKLPDFDRALEAWRKNDATFFSNDNWDYNSCSYTWNANNIPDTLDYRAAVLFCGFWNDEYGDHFSLRISEKSQNKNAYHGPAVVNVEFLRALIKDHTPSQISAELSRIVIANEKNYHFNHRNSWSRKELEALLVSYGFKEITFDKDMIILEHKNIPGIREMEAISMYCMAKK